MPADRLWGRIVVVDRLGEADRLWLLGPGRPTIDTVGLLALLALAAKRLGGWLAVDDACPELQALLELAGLAVEMEREPEGREQPLGLEE
jgi:hypothetical protein